LVRAFTKGGIVTQKKQAQSEVISKIYKKEAAGETLV
jgi:hypothetical protein